MAEGLETLEAATEIMLNVSEDNALSGANAYLQICGDVISGACLIRACCRGFEAGDEDAANMLALTRFHALTYMPRAVHALAYLPQAAASIFDFPKRSLADL